MKPREPINQIAYATRAKKIFEPKTIFWDTVGLYSAGMKGLLAVSDEIPVTIVLRPTKKGSHAIWIDATVMEVKVLDPLSITTDRNPTPMHMMPEKA